MLLEQGSYRSWKCVVPEKIHTHPMEGHWKFLGGGRVLKAKCLEEMYENKPEFPGEVQTKKPSVGGVWIFSGTAQSWKVLEFYFGIFQDWKVLEDDYKSWKVQEICI